METGLTLVNRNIEKLLENTETHIAFEGWPLAIAVIGCSAIFAAKEVAVVWLEQKGTIR